MMHHDMGTGNVHNMEGHGLHDMGMHGAHDMKDRGNMESMGGMHDMHSMHHASGDAPGMCTMNMIWNSDVKGMCIVHRAWHVRTERQFLFACAMVCLLAFLYEWLKLMPRSLDAAISHAEAVRSGAHMYRESDDVPTRTRAAQRRVMPLAQTDVLEGESGKRAAVLRLIPSLLHTPSRLRVVSTCLYGAQVALSCFLMLVMMTYNAWLIAAIVVGAMLGAAYSYNARQALPAEHAALCH